VNCNIIVEYNPGAFCLFLLYSLHSINELQDQTFHTTQFKTFIAS